MRLIKSDRQLSPQTNFQWGVVVHWGSTGSRTQENDDHLRRVHCVKTKFRTKFKIESMNNLSSQDIPVLFHKKLLLQSLYLGGSISLYLFCYLS